jgi:ABC-type transport system substrate-binding protein
MVWREVPSQTAPTATPNSPGCEGRSLAHPLSFSPPPPPPPPRYSNPKLDALIDAIRIEPDLAKRRAMVRDALRLLNAELPLVPLYRRQHNWVMRPGIEAVQWPSDTLELRWVVMK